MSVRFAKFEELGRVNELRRQVNELHAEGKPEIFKKGFGKELSDYIFEIFDDPQKEIIVCEREGKICGFAVLNHIIKPENPFMYERRFLDIDEFCVDEDERRKKVGAEMIDFVRQYAKDRGFDRIELNMWEFNRDALEFYEAQGFATYRRYMEIKL
ncbi:MAG: GNAT family N-acetyltransferase [Clostridia bacterium]|nr:GNAT family N-acetyltransferase [Clostridia bacterium]